MKKWILRISITLNILFLLLYFWNVINTPTNELGMLKEDIEVGHFMGKETVFTLPKGLTVRNNSERGLSAIGQFENNRFYIVVTSDKELVDYNVSSDKLNSFSNFYSAEFKTFLSNDKNE